MDIVPTREVYARTDRALATAYFHWFFLIQPHPLPERLLAGDPEYYLRSRLLRWGNEDEAAFAPEAVAEYLRCFDDPRTIHATCEDYRAAATIDLEHDEADSHHQIACPLLVLWGARGFVGRSYDVLDIWRRHAREVEGGALDCGHFLAEEQPEATLARFQAFFGAG
jgi:haloacetate dehalogenase